MDVRTRKPRHLYFASYTLAAHSHCATWPPLLGTRNEAVGSSQLSDSDAIRRSLGLYEEKSPQILQLFLRDSYPVRQRSALSRVIYIGIEFLLRPGRGEEYCDQFVCLSVREHISVTAGLTFMIFCVDPMWPWLGAPLAALRYRDGV